MYLYSKLAGVVTDKIEIPAELADYTMKIVHFVLQSPCLESDRAEFEIGKEKTMETTNSQNQAENTNVNEEVKKEMPKANIDMLNRIALIATMIKVQELEHRISELENKTCCCQSCKTEPTEVKEEQAA